MECRHEVIRFDVGDADELAQGLAHGPALFEQHFDQLSPGRFQGSFVEVSFGEVQVYVEQSNQSIYQTGQIRADACGLAIATAVEGRAIFAGSTLAAGELMTLANGAELDFCTARIMRTIGLIASNAWLTELDGDRTDLMLAPARAGIADAEVSQVARLREVLESILCGVTSRAMTQFAEVAVATAIDELADALLGLTRDAYKRRASGAVWIARRRVVERARDYIRSHVADPLTIAMLCQAMHVSRRTLQYCFDDVLGMTPLAYLKAVRLNGVRRVLKTTSDVPTCIGDVAAQWGFWHLSHFREDYRLMFDENPSDTVRQAGRRQTHPVAAVI